VSGERGRPAFASERGDVGQPPSGIGGAWKSKPQELIERFTAHVIEGNRFVAPPARQLEIRFVVA